MVKRLVVLRLITATESQGYFYCNLVATYSGSAMEDGEVSESSCLSTSSVLTPV